MVRAARRSVTDNQSVCTRVSPITLLGGRTRYGCPANSAISDGCGAQRELEPHKAWIQSKLRISWPSSMVTDVAALLRERGVQVTAQRLAVLRAVARHSHISADTVADIVRTEIGVISQQSVYDALGLLVSEGLIRRIQPSGSPARFEARVGDNHHHLICRTCGGVVDVDCAAGFVPCLTPIDDQGYEIDEAEVVYWGRCPACVERAGRSPAGSDGQRTARAGRQQTAGARQTTNPPTSRKRTRRSRKRRAGTSRG